MKYPKPSKCRCKTYPLLISLTFFIFAATNFLLFCFLYNRSYNAKSGDNGNWSDKIKLLLNKNFNLMKNEWRLAGRDSAEYVDFNCSSLKRGEPKEFVAGGWTKRTYRTSVNGVDVAVKYVNLHGYDITSCMYEKKRTLYNCYMSAASKLIEEIVRLNTLRHPNVIKLLGYCIPEIPDINEDKSVSIITELGEPINTIKLLLMTWEERLKISLEVARLIHHLSVSTVALNDFRRQQFVFVRGDLKLVDVDDIGLKDPVCNQNSCCIDSQNKSLCVPCTNHVCVGYNEKINIFSAGKHFIKHILPYEVPRELQTLVNEINQAYERVSWTSKKILHKTEYLTRLYMKGLNHNVTS